MKYRKQYELLIDEIEALIGFIGPANDSRIDIIPPLYDEIQELMPDRLFTETAPLLRECRSLVSRYKVESAEEASAILDSLSSSIRKVKQLIKLYDSTVEPEPLPDKSYRKQA